MIPNKKEKEDDIKNIIERLKNFGIDKFSVTLEVAPYRSHDLQYDIDLDNKNIHFDVYSARYPESLYGWLNNACREIALKLKVLEK